ncbi:hypothetical protein A3E95_01855 [Candidatus Nomurabacteria bacterium RIFCSPHIGHO2_12_FULL_44_22b]|nr:MAG: hypothetical protein A3E95_01855 [Candidatus Nomurabacteria bacterium RIFCSPHIGHO2_12_FULL_44_22b]
MNYYKGKYSVDRENRKNEWLVGPFMNERGPDYRGTKHMAIKFWEFKKDKPKEHNTKFQRFCTECTILLSGKLKAMIDNEEFEFNAGEYVVIPPNIKSNLAIELLTDKAEGITIKAPSFILPKVELGTSDDTVKL